MLLAQILSHAFGRLPAQWAERGLAYFPWSLGPSCFLWVDNLYVLGRDEAAVAEMLGDAGAALRAEGFYFKPTSLQVMRGGRVPAAQGAVPLPARAGSGPAGEVPALQRMFSLRVLEWARVE